MILQSISPLLRSCRLATVRCCCCSANSVQSPASGTRRRDFVLSSGMALWSVVEDARAGVERYVIKRKLDPLETYIPDIVLCQSQFQELEAKLGLETVEYREARSLLRSGPAGSLRSNIRAVAEYASESGEGPAAADAVKLCLRSLEDLDSMLLRRSRDDTSITLESLKAKLGTSMQALDRLLQTVPAPVLERGKAAAMEFLDDTSEIVIDDAEIKGLEDLIPSK